MCDSVMKDITELIYVGVITYSTIWDYVTHGDGLHPDSKISASIATLSRRPVMEPPKRWDNSVINRALHCTE
jgi:hypothetical protein